MTRLLLRREEETLVEEVQPQVSPNGLVTLMQKV